MRSPFSEVQHVSACPAFWGFFLRVRSQSLLIRCSAALPPPLQGHVYSLGSTLSAALNFVIEPELEAELGEEVQRLLEQMQEEKPEDRPHLQVQTRLISGVTWVLCAQSWLQL